MSAVLKRDNFKKVLVQLSKKSQGAEIQRHEAQVILEELERYWEKFEDAQFDVVEETKQPDDAEMESLQKLFFDAKIRLRVVINNTEAPTALPPAQAAPINMQPPAPRVNTKMKIGAITLPKFNGDYRDWTSFEDLFTSLVRNDESISPAQKLYLLKAHVTGEAEALIKGFPVTDANFEMAWTLLKGRFENKRFIVDAHLKTLIHQTKLVTESAKGLKSLVDATREAVRCLEALNIPVEHWDTILVFILTSKLDPETHRQWELSLSDPSALAKFEDLLKYLDSRWKSLEMVPVLSKPRTVTNSPNPKVSIPSAQALVATQDSSLSCRKCNGEHELYQCEQFKALEVSEKRRLVQDNSLCFKCLKPGHLSSRCGAKRCPKCHGRHHYLVHQDYTGSSKNTSKNSQPSTAMISTQSESTNKPSSHVSAASSSSINTLHSQGNSQVLLSTAMIILKDENGKDHSVRALLDSGSEATFMTEECAQRLKLRRSPVYIPITGVGSTSAGSSHGAVNVNIFSHTDSTFNIQVKALILNKLTNFVPKEQISGKVWPHLAGITLADSQFGQPGRIDILFGADVYGDILRDGLIPSKNDSPTAQNTSFGWILIGRTSATATSTITCNAVSIENHLQLEQTLRRFWEVESVDENVNTLSADDQFCEEHFQRTHMRDETGRFVVNLPLSGEHRLGESKSIAFKRFYSVERRLNAQPSLKAQYLEFMEEYEALGHMALVDSSSHSTDNDKSFFLPHHAVLKASSTTTKVRVVFDASSKSTSGTSLNDVLLTGPKLQDNLFDIVLRFRLHRVALSADIAKMYRQILVHEDDQRYQKILWRKNSSTAVSEWQLKTVTYGLAAAPFLAIRSLRQLAVDEAIKFPAASETVLSDFYVDDLITGCEDSVTAIQRQKDLIALLQLGGFQLRKWSSNEPAALENLPASFRESKSPLSMTDDEAVGTLGILWYPNVDNFGFIVHRTPVKNVTSKRTILSEISQLFDPLGWLTPTIVIGKMLIQELWMLGVDWDQAIPTECENRWLAYKNGLTSLESIRIPRWLNTSSTSTVQLHGFSDASERAYAGVVYLRAISEDGSISTTLVTAKSKVAPVKTLSIPRLELCGAQILAKLLVHVQKTLRLPETIQIFAYSDSTIVLAWLQKLPSTLKTFVANRVSDIQSRMPPSHWRHVKSEDNPADSASRGVFPEALPSLHTWWHGPIWLSLPEANWPSQMIIESIPEAQLENKKASTAVLSSTIQKPSDEWALLEKQSSLTRLVRVTAYLMRASFNFKHSTDRRSGFLTTVELHAAMSFWIIRSQQLSFKAEIECLLKNTRLPRSSKLLKLKPLLGDDGILKVGGRLSSANVSEKRRNPIILDQNSRLTFLLISYMHLNLLHSGVQLTLAQLRQQYWIIGGRRAVAKLIHKCLVCCRHKKLTHQQIMGNLPPERVQPCRPFMRSGVDYAGPINLRMVKGRGTRGICKGYIALFVCFATKAVHLEVVSDLSTDAFLAAFRRFVARRGICQQLFSDNGTNFVGARRELQSMLADHNLANSIITSGTSWHMIPPGSPHQGGLWEAGVKAVKHHLRRVLGIATITFEEMATILAQVEACLNSRPLCPLTDDPEDLEALTPAHFLIGEPLNLIPEPDLVEVPVNRLKRWHRIQQMTQHFWHRWQTEYLSSLQERTKWKQPSVNLTEGAMVLIKDDRLPPAQWKLGRVLQCHPGDDGLVRVATVRYQGGTTKRAIQKLIVLPKDN